MSEEKKSGDFSIRPLQKSGDETWTVQEYGERLFSVGGYLFGPQNTMFRLAVASLCIDVLSQDIAKTPLQLRRRTSLGSELVLPKEHPIARLLIRGPNEFVLGMNEFTRQMVAHLAISSEYFLAGRRNRFGEILEFAGIPRMNVTQTTVNVEARKWFYQITPGTLHDQALFGWAAGMQSNKTIAHIKHRSLNGHDAIATNTLSKSAMNLLETMQNYQSGSYSNAGIPALAFAFPDALEDKQFERLKNGFTEAVGKAKKEGKPVILEGADGEIPQVHKLAQSATDSDFIKANIVAAMDVIRYFRVPPHKVYLMDSIKYDNLDSAERIYVDDTLCSYFMDIQEGMNRALLTDDERDEFFFQFDVEKAYALNPAERQKIVESRWKSGQITYDEMRRAIGENAVGGDQGDYRMISGNFVVVDKDGEVVLKAGGNAPDQNTDNQDDEPAKPSKKTVPDLRLVGN